MRKNNFKPTDDIRKTNSDKKIEKRLDKQDNQKFNDDYPVEELSIAMKQERNKTKSQKESSSDKDPINKKTDK